MSSDISQVIKELQGDGEAISTRAFRQAIGNVESVAKRVCPVGHYGRARGKGGKSGGDLKQSLIVEFTGKKGASLTARCASALPYAAAQHDEAFHHPGLYSGGSAGPKYAAKYFERAAGMVFGDGTDPLGQHSGDRPETFQDLLKKESQ
jgi:hypothetical protein